MATKKTTAPAEAETNVETNVNTEATVDNEAVQAQVITDPGEELVTIQLFKDNGRYKDDLYVCVNGERLLIQRGKPVQVKRKFAEVIESSMRQDQLAGAMMQRLEDDYIKATAEKTQPA